MELSNAVIAGMRFCTAMSLTVVLAAPACAKAASSHTRMNAASQSILEGADSDGSGETSDPSCSPSESALFQTADRSAKLKRDLKLQRINANERVVSSR